MNTHIDELAKKKYSILKLSHEYIKRDEIQEIISMLGTVHAQQININILNGNNGVINNNGNGNHSNIVSFTSSNNPDGAYRTDFYNMYKNFCTSRGVPPISQREFAKEIGNMGYKDGRKGTRHIWRK